MSGGSMGDSDPFRHIWFDVQKNNLKTTEKEVDGKKVQIVVDLPKIDVSKVVLPLRKSDIKTKT